MALLRELFWYADHRLSGLSPDEAMARTHIARESSPSDEEPEPPPDESAEASGQPEDEPPGVAESGA